MWCVVSSGKFCGNTPPDPFTSATKTLSVEFVSDATVRRTGFSATFHAVTPCPGDGRDPPRSPRCSDAPDEFYNYCKDLGYQKTLGPNMFGQALNEVPNSQHWSEMREANASCHLQLRQFLCSLLMPHCHVNIVRRRIQKQLPCRSWCEEVKSSCPLVFANGSSFESTDCNLLNSTDCVNLESDEDCYYGTGQNYKGMTTLPEEGGSTCLNWTSVLSSQLIAKYNWADPRENYCRNFAIGNTEAPFCMVKTVANGKELIAMEPCGLRPCNAIGCGVPPDVTFGRRSPVKNFYMPGETVFISCNTGYILGTEETRITCTQNGTWSKTDISCSADYSLQLSHVLLDTERYLSQLPPSTDHVNVTFEAAMVEIIDADEKNEYMFGSFAFRLRWKDNRLSWTPARYGDVTQLVLTTEDVWIPNIYLMRNGDAKFSTFPAAPVTVTSEGEVEWDIIDLLTTTCDLEPALFPFDSMTCPVCLGTTTSVERFNCPNPGDDRKLPELYIEHFMKCGDQGEEVVDQWNAKWTVTVEGGVFGQGCISVTFNRIPTFHSCTTLSPVIILSILMCITFILPIDKGDRLSFGITILLSMVVSLVFITDVLPAKGSMPVVAILIVVYMCLMGIFLIATVIVIKISSREGDLPPLIKKVFLRYLARIVLLGDMTKQHSLKFLQVDVEDFEMVHVARKKTSVSTQTSDAEIAKASKGANKSKSTPAEPKMQTEVLKRLQDTVRDLGNAVNNLTASKHSKTDDNEDSVKTDYEKMARVLDRMCVALYVFSLIISIPIIRYSA
ncbi:neuronal acetylcholine receptor subunit beta-3-like [Branchiostoma floridae]|uniref:Neuronal acetylcholine receptor subunit beta-3-like n=1 Tax=Branchiostoma floridae TaxID=7739 RepID=A0A9J7MUX5_BRAFL|nr:neuronal acetylcholine receptor subunit beta-3-like [Branchiostoma floridae]